jgi:ABC-type branched-subunit amino acid transport system ATPase component
MVERQADAESLRTQAVAVDFEGLRALDKVDLEFSRGEILGLIGPNGAGKTTLVNVVSGYQRPTTGSVHMGSLEITGLAPHKVTRHGVARSFQAGRPFPALTVAESVEVAALGSGCSRAQAREVTNSLMTMVGLASRRDEPSATLPYGDQRKLGVIRALATDPAFLLLDEPAAGLSEREADDLVVAIRLMRDDFGCGVLLIEHDMRVVMDLCERIQVLDYGRTISLGTPERVREDPKVIEAYLGASA